MRGPTPLPTTTTIYGVFEVPSDLAQARLVESTWDNEQRARDRARVRGIQVHGRVFVLAWSLNRPGARQVATFVDGEPAAARRLS